MKWRDYHEATKHSVESLRRSQHALDWANMPDPFRHYEGAPVLDLPADPPAPGAPALDGAAFLSQLLFYSAAISASKLVPSTGYRYALRVNPSSGNLHPTEFHFVTRSLKNWPDGLYHYRPSSHMAEQRALGNFQLGPADAPVVFMLTSIAWREAWKYRDRAYRYCLHDIGHAWQAIALAARAMGCQSYAIGQFPDENTAALCHLNGDEWPMLLVALRGGPIPFGEQLSGATVWHGGVANTLSTEILSYPRIDRVHAATRTVIFSKADLEVRPHEISPTHQAFGEVARTRRSALDFVGGTQSMSLTQLLAILHEAVRPFAADFAEGFITLYIYVHRVDGVEPGVYRFSAQNTSLDQVKAGDQRVAAAGLSLGQNLAGNACVAFSMIGDLDRATRVYGDRGYRYVHFEAGAIGQRLYIAATTLGLGATGIGAFYDDEVHRYLNLTSEEEQVVYHFAIGYPILDPRVGA